MSDPQDNKTVVELPDDLGFTDTTVYTPTKATVYPMSGENVIVVRVGEPSTGVTVLALSPAAWQLIIGAVTALTETQVSHA